MVLDASLPNPRQLKRRVKGKWVSGAIQVKEWVYLRVDSHRKKEPRIALDCGRKTCYFTLSAEIDTLTFFKLSKRKRVNKL